MEYRKHFEAVLNFIDTNRPLIDCHLVDFITGQLWDECLPNKLKSQLEEIDIDEDTLICDDISTEVNAFIQSTKLLSLESCSDTIDLKNVPETLLEFLNNGCTFRCEAINPKVDFMNPKKCHEVGTLGEIVAEIAKSTSSLVIDAGAGKAYLSTYLSENYGLPVLAIDSSKQCHTGAIRRQDKMQKRKKQHSAVVRYVVKEINSETDYGSLVKSNFPKWNVNKNLILSGLHTCGSLVQSVINAFLNTKDIQCLCVVPCCYHLSEGSYNNKLNLSRNAKMLAQQSVERTVRSKQLPESLFFRALLQVLLHSIGVYGVTVGRGGPKNSFVDYANWALVKVGVPVEKIPPPGSLKELYERHKAFKMKMDVFQLLRIHLSRVLEAAILLDKLIFLHESKQCSKVAILRAFDPTLSPRCYALFASK